MDRMIQSRQQMSLVQRLEWLYLSQWEGALGQQHDQLAPTVARGLQRQRCSLDDGGRP